MDIYLGVKCVLRIIVEGTDVEGMRVLNQVQTIWTKVMDIGEGWDCQRGTLRHIRKGQADQCPNGDC